MSGNRFENKVVIVTGGAKGMGEAAAHAFAGEGASVVIADVDAERGANLAGAIESAGGRAIFQPCDVSLSEAVELMVSETVSQFGGVDVLFNNAGIQTYGFVEDMPEEEFDLTMAVNFKSAFLTCKFVIPEMRKRGGGAIINNASVQGIASQRTVAAYAASKGAMISFTQALAVDHGHENIRVNCILPGGVRTPMLRDSALKFEQNADIAETFARWGKPYPAGRLGKPEEVAALVLFLASDEASFCTGGAYRVDGGLLAALASAL